MPHIIVEYTDNIKDEAQIPELLKKLHDVLIARPTIFPIGGIRSRAFELTNYRIADGTEDDAFVHVTLKIGNGRSSVDKKAACDEMFEVLKGHFSPLLEKRYLTLSLELYEFVNPTYKYGNIHGRFK
ncbi:MAG TPA: 5-carboxymethyl-2-hydroxymuconate Delta-isomerase [Bacillus sp. (in: firmicutes)]|uniref:5-carboxymethyl-2-hydroxymuconate Delta-isomerase n=1 Tax=Bacillus litorisediminis TaxID=2922713 RepID=UPI001FACC3C2|nr:5-carboxymethyl-2-hydroxymuconate Delta-isomerase [Bacillus litorisediminis]HWO75184.1 5-carboxymethyl-2-hydroxymuconate Delta-isomerase [Bacillus sp. (in: firmicutes)]